MSGRNAFDWVTVLLIISSLLGSTRALKFIEEPKDTTVPDGERQVILKCLVDDTSAKISWFKDDNPIVEDFTHYTFLSKPTSRGSLRITNIQKSDAGNYHCTANSLPSRYAKLTVELFLCENGFKIKTASSAFRGENVELSCNCPAVPSPTYIWKKNGQTLNFTGKDLVLSNATSGKDNGKYVCIATGSRKQATSLPHNLVISDIFFLKNCSPAKIDPPPRKQVIFVANKPLMVDCQATGDPAPTVSWYGKNDAQLTNTSNIHIFANGTLHFINTKRRDKGRYKCQASNACKNSRKHTIELKHAKIGTFTPIDDQLNRVGSTLSLTCDPPADSIPPISSVTWKLGNGNPLPNDTRFSVQGNTLKIEKTVKADSGKYQCVAENMAGTKALNVSVTIAVYPKLVKSPVNKTVVEGTSVKLECQFSGDPRPDIVWEKDGEKVPDRAKKTADGSVLTLKNVDSRTSGLYRCSANLKHITERSNEARLKVREKVRIEKIAGELKFDNGTVAKLNCKVMAGEEPLDVHWSKRGLLKGLLPHMKVVESMLWIENVQMTDKGDYICEVNNSFSTASLTFAVVVYDFAKITQKPRNITVMVNSTAMFDCVSTGTPEPRVVWYQLEKKKWEPMQNDSETIFHPNGSLHLINVQKEDERSYKCLAGNPGDIVDAVANLKVVSREIIIRTTERTVDTTNNKSKVDDHGNDNMGKTIGIAVGCAGAYIILVVGLMIYCKGRRARQAKKKLVVNGEEAPLNPIDSGDKVEVVKTSCVDNARQYPRQDLETLRTLGSGSYGNVFLAKAPEIVEGESSSVVVVQSLTSRDEDVKKDFMKMIEMLSLKNENIAKLLGVCQEQEPMYLISEYPEQGDLKTVMRDSSSPLSPTQKVNICAAIASGMNYLTNHGHVHKDLATRNCLVNKSFQVKISFLSLNQGTYPKEYYKRDKEIIPLRWMAPEALKGEYSDMSDVWSFGVLMWEVYSNGVLPYEERSDKEVLYSVPDDLRLTKPDGCPGRIYKMMEKCWADEKENRCTFGELCDDLSEIPRESNF